jgi:hypothetical protein
MRRNMLSHELAKISLFLFSSGQITVLCRFIDNDLDAGNSKALSLILVFKIDFKFCKNGGCAEISNVTIFSS